MKKQFLECNWVLSNEKIGTIDASVPGCVHTDLAAAGIIKDLFYRDNNKQYLWIENEDFTYSCCFDAKTEEKASIVFEGLDTYCDVYLNGKCIGSAQDMFIPYSFDVSGLLRERDNKLEVRFRSPVKEVEGREALEGAFTTERLHTRRIQCTYGWDWVDRFVTCGIYRPVYISYGNDMHASSAYIYTENLDKYSAQLYLELEFENYTEGACVTVDIISPDGDIVNKAEFFCKEPMAVRRFDIAEPELWYPLGYGKQPLYTLCITVNENVYTETFGIRTLKILQLPDKVGSEYYERAKRLQAGEIGQIFDRNEEYSGFQLIVNGKRILCCGANWVPSEPFPSAETHEKYDKLIALAEKMGLNMLRVWGGGIFEDKYFYECCDRAGILVMQDFLMACGTYPENEEWFIELQRKEAEFAARYLRNHPCLAFWNGDNENATEASEDMPEYRGRKATVGAIAPVLYRLDRSRVFLPSSPFGGKTYASLTSGTTHNTNYIDRMFNYFYNTDCKDYKEYLSGFTARFISEEPVFGAVGTSSALRFMSEADLDDPEQNMLRYHTKNNPWLEHEVFDYLTIFALKMLGAPADSEERLFKYRYMQFEWYRVVLENLRRNIGFCNGLVFWMFNDCWPASLGWSVIDYYCCPKSGFYQFKRCSSDVVTSVTADDEGYTVTASNSAEKTAVLHCRALRFVKGESERDADVFEFELKASGYATESIRLPWRKDEQNVIICDSVFKGGSDRAFYKHGALELHRANDRLCVVARDESSITVEAKRYIHAVEFDGDAVFEDNYFTLLAGERRTVMFESLSENGTEFAVSAYTF